MAIRLKNISTYELIRCAEIKKEFDLAHKEIYNWLISNQVDNYQKLKNLLFGERTGLSDIATEQLIIYFSRVEKRLNNANKEEKTPKIFTFDCYDKLDIDRTTLDYTDNNTKGGVLLFGSPINKVGFSILDRLDELSIAEIKALLSSLSSTNFRNGLTNVRYLKSDDCVRIAKLVEFYEHQVIRQSFDTDENGINLFELNRDAKRQIAQENIVQIIEYIIANAQEECIWGSISPSQKRIFALVAGPNSKAETNENIRKILIDRIANYTTLGELETGIFKEQEVITVEGGKVKRKSRKPIDRFIVR